MTIYINGERIELLRGATIADAVHRVAGAQTRGVAVAVDGAVVKRDEWHRALEEGQRVEILRATAGG